MSDPSLIVTILGLVVPIAPFLLVCVLGISALAGHRLSERMISGCSQLAISTGLIAALVMLGVMLVQGYRHIPIEIGSWVVIDHLYHLKLKFVFDRLSVPFAILSFILCGTIGAFAHRYMHREPGFSRFFVLYALFVLGMIMTSLSDTIETLFAGWELVGLSSALLVAFFHERPSPVRNGLRVWTVYRVSDAALLVAALTLHHMTGEGDFDKLMGAGWPMRPAELSTTVTAYQAFIVGLLLLIAAAGKSALVPFSGWLPRAMEGPTPSSAVFYGALSVHLGAFLLLRVSPILEQSIPLCAIVVVLGLVTAVFASLAGSVQTDIKSALCFASLMQVGIIVAEIGLGFRYVALIHILGHACLRTLQFVRAPTLLQDYRAIENAIGSGLPRFADPVHALVPDCYRLWLYRFALERGYLDAMLTDYIAMPVLKLFRTFDAWERRSTDWLSGEVSRESERIRPATESFDDLL